MKRPATRRPTCGTHSGYRAHIRNHEETCADCRAAHRAYRANRRAIGAETRGQCVDCDRPAYGLRCRKCSDRIAAPKPEPYAQDIAFAGTWRRDGLIWRPVVEEGAA